jgi:hypothetical protein
MRFLFGSNEWKSEAEISVRPGMFDDGLEITVWVPELENATLTLDPVYFVWQSVPVNRPETRDGQR